MNTKLVRLGVVWALVLGCQQAQSLGILADVSVINRDTGDALPIYSSKGAFWVQGTQGVRYAIAIRNRIGERLMVVAAVDGINVINGMTAAWSQIGYVLDRNVAYEISGWRKSNATIASFEFAAPNDSYAGFTGRPQQVGMIAVALFKERLPESTLPSVPPTSPMAVQQKSVSTDTPKLGTAHGQREESYASQTTFLRLQLKPNEVITIRYDSRENLISAGVICEDSQRSPEFFQNPETLSYVPDPAERRH